MLFIRKFPSTPSLEKFPPIPSLLRVMKNGWLAIVKCFSWFTWGDRSWSPVPLMTTSQSKSQVIFQRVGGGEEEQSPAHKSLAGNLVRGVYSFLVRCLIWPLVFSAIPLPTCSQSPQFLNLCRILFSSQYFYCEIKKHFFLLIQKVDK